LLKLYEKYERYLSPIALLTGFIWDNLTLRRVDLWLDNLVLLGYLLISGSAIAVLNTRQSGWIRQAAPFLLQFAFGGLFSAFVIFYSRSASLVTSWPFLAILAVLLIGNEVFRKHYGRFVFHTAIFFVAIFSYSILIVPTILGTMGSSIFLLGGLVSVSLMGLVIVGLSMASPLAVREQKGTILLTILGIYAFFHLLYFTNVIPPIPLSLKDGGIYHSISKTEKGYEVSFEPSSRFLFFREYSNVFHLRPGEAVYAYSSIFAPTRLNTKIFHRWSYFDEKKEGWVTTDRLGFAITGGRDGGNRGYTFKTSILPARWRVEAVTERDQLLGRMNFEAVEAVGDPELKTGFK
jgi:hypothetical protein